jgi:membrane-associated phospholipid phosphatase
VDIPIIASGLALNSYALFKSVAVDQPNTDQLRSWNRQDVSSWERSATYNWNESAADWSDIGQVTGTVAPLLLLASDRIRGDAGKVGLMYLETFMINQGIIASLKATVLRKRPFVYNEDVNYELKYRKTVFFSFASGHTAASASMSFFTAKVYGEYYPDSPYKKYIWMGAALVPAVTGYLRYEAGKHFLTDVIAGYGIGFLVGYFIPELHSYSPKHNFSHGIAALNGGIGWRFTWNI